MATLRVAPADAPLDSTAERSSRDRAARPGNSSTPTAPRRRRVKRNGSPTLRFITATNPADFKDEQTMQDVRSQAMIHYRYNSNQRKSKNDKNCKGKSIPASRSKHVLSPLTSRRMGQSRTHRVSLSCNEQDQSFLTHTTRTNKKSSRRSSRASSRRSDHAQHSTVTLSSEKKRREAARTENISFRERMALRLMKATMASVFKIGDSVDPFNAMPQWQSPELNSVYLQLSCVRAFSSEVTLRRWLPAMLSHPHILLSSTALTSTWLDMHERISGDSRRTMLVKTEIIAMVNERLDNPATRHSETTLMIILHLLGGEMWNCDEGVIRIHGRGICRFIESVGGLHKFSNRAIVEVAAACCYHCDIFCESSPIPPFDKLDPHIFTLNDESSNMPESPVFCPGSQFASIKPDSYCKPHTMHLLYEMRDLTDLFLSPETHLDNFGASDPHVATHAAPDSLDRMTRISEISARVAGLPSAYLPDHPATNDWVYEACRIASLIYATAIVMRVPFAVAAGASSRTKVSGMPSEPSRSASLAESLYEALNQTDLANVWHDMSGVLYWVTAVGAAAARTTVTLDMTKQTRARNEAYSVWVRRCLIMFATRVMIILVFQYPLPVIIAQKNILKVQELIHSENVI